VQRLERSLCLVQDKATEPVLDKAPGRAMGMAMGMALETVMGARETLSSTALSQG
jgi:hypothetical protein